MFRRCAIISLPFLVSLLLAAYELEKADPEELRTRTVSQLGPGARPIRSGADRHAARAWASRSECEPAPRHPLRPFLGLVHLAYVTLAPIAHLADEALLRRVEEGDVDALEALYRAYESTVFTLGRRLCGSEEGADDILQETFLEVSRSLGRYRGDGSLSGWIKKICISKALMRLRRTIRFADESVESAAEMILGQPDSLSSRLDIEQAMMRLGDTARVVVWLHDVEGFTHEEIAALMGMSVSFSKSQLSRAHARLRALLGEERGTPCGT